MFVNEMRETTTHRCRKKNRISLDSLESRLTGICQTVLYGFRKKNQRTKNMIAKWFGKKYDWKENVVHETFVKACGLQVFEYNCEPNPQDERCMMSYRCLDGRECPSCDQNAGLPHGCSVMAATKAYVEVNPINWPKQKREINLCPVTIHNQ